MHLTETNKPVNPVTETQTICPGATIEDWYGQSLTPTETNHVFTHTIEGEESNTLVTLEVSFFDVPDDIEKSDYFFTGGSYEWYGETYIEGGDYTVPLTTENGCGYTATLHLTETNKPVNPVTETQTICPGATIEDWYGQNLTPTETNHVFTHTIEGEESNTLVTLEVSFFDVPDDIEKSDYFFTGGSYEWYGETYTEGGDYTVPLTTENGCGYTATLHLTETNKPNRNADNMSGRNDRGLVRSGFDAYRNEPRLYPYH